MKFSRRYLDAYFILGSKDTAGRDPLIILEKALQGGITCFQFREKGLGAKQGTAKKELAQAMQKRCKKYRVPFVVNDDVDLAIELNADGIHVGQEDESIYSIRQKLTKDTFIGVSATSVVEAVQALRDQADYIGVGPIFQTSTKKDAKQPIGLEGIVRIRKAVNNLPIVAIGGISATNVSEIRQAGADGVSIISAISMAENPFQAAKQFRHESKMFE